MKIQFDVKNRIVDIFVEKDEECPVPFLSDDGKTAHEGVSFDYFRWFMKEKLSELDGLDVPEYDSLIRKLKEPSNVKFDIAEAMKCPECGNEMLPREAPEQVDPYTGNSYPEVWVCPMCGSQWKENLQPKIREEKGEDVTKLECEDCVHDATYPNPCFDCHDKSLYRPKSCPRCGGRMLSEYHLKDCKALTPKTKLKRGARPFWLCEDCGYKLRAWAEEGNERQE